MIHVTTYIVYILLAVATIQVMGSILYRNGKIFLKEVFKGEFDIYINPVNTLLLIGFHLINTGMILLSISTSQNLETIGESLGFITQKLGAVCLILGGMHAFNLITFRIVKNRIAQLTTN